MIWIWRTYLSLFLIYGVTLLVENLGNHLYWWIVPFGILIGIYLLLDTFIEKPKITTTAPWKRIGYKRTPRIFDMRRRGKK